MMENFKKLIHKNPELQNTESKEFSAEQLEYSENIAKEKLAKILESGFRNFGIRYMNLEEYRTIIETGKLSGEFSLFDKIYKKDIDFSKFLTQFNDGFHTMHSVAVTQWEEISGLASIETMDLITGIKSIRNNYAGKSIGELNPVLRKYILNFIDTGVTSPRVTIPGDHSLYSNTFSRLRTPSAFRNLNYDIKKLDTSDENLKTIEDFKNNDSFLLQKNNLRKLLIALGTAYDNPKGNQERQYHLALIVDDKLLKSSGNSWGDDGWKELYEHQLEKINEKEIQSYIVGAISIYPLKEMYDEIIKLEKGSKDLAHPVFDHKGIIRWPKDDKNKK